jgi:hypothetical protein
MILLEWMTAPVFRRAKEAHTIITRVRHKRASLLENQADRKCGLKVPRWIQRGGPEVLWAEKRRTEQSFKVPYYFMIKSGR